MGNAHKVDSVAGGSSKGMATVIAADIVCAGLGIDRGGPMESLSCSIEWHCKVSHNHKTLP